MHNLAQRDRKHRDTYTGKNKPHLEGVETITRIGETDQGVTIQILKKIIPAYLKESGLVQNQPFNPDWSHS